MTQARGTKGSIISDYSKDFSATSTARLLPSELLARLAQLHSTGLALALRGGLATSDRNTRDSPAGAGCTQDVVRHGARLDGAGDALECETCDRDAAGGCAGGRSVLVVLLDDNSVLRDVRHGDAAVGHVLDRAGCAGDGLDADGLVGVGDDVVGDVDVGDSVVVTAADGSDGDAVSAGACT